MIVKPWLAVFGISTSLVFAVPAAAQNAAGGQAEVFATPAIRITSASPTKADQSRPLMPKGDYRLWITQDDYPSKALFAEQQGTTHFLLSIDGRGRLMACAVTISSGSDSLDAQTCKLLMRRARFIPRLDYHGKPVPATWSSHYVWALPTD